VYKPFQPRELQMRLEAAKRLIDQMSSDGARSGAAITPQPGDVVGGRYRLTSLLGAGAMGTVWEAEHMVLRSRVAVKFLRPEQASSEAIRARFETEARLGAQIASPYVVRVFDSGIAEGAPYLVMDLVRGRTLSDAVAQEGPKSPPEVARIVRQVASALMCAHAGGVIHRDVKPENVLLDGDASRPGGYTAKLIDFGVARVEDTGDAERPSARSHPQTEAGMILGTPHFMSPEYVTSCHADRALDVWGLAATAYFAMAGEVPFDGDTLWNIVAKVCHAPLPVPSQHNPRVPPGFDAWFAQACDRDPSRRFRDADELAVTLERVCAPLRAPVVLSRPSAPSRRPWKSVSAFALAMLGALVVLSACFSIH
jgi:serine/threonine-protein kinase